MARPGRKPKNGRLHLIEGTRRVGRHPGEEVLRERAEKSEAIFGPLTKPEYLTGEGSDAWDRYIVPCFWLDGSREALAILFCELWHEFRLDPKKFTSGKHERMRRCMSELGLTDERNRSGNGSEKDHDEFLD